MNDLEHELRRRVEGDVRFDHYSRLLYSTDASMYQMEPMGVVIPRHADDVQAAIEVANQLGAPLLPRGGGTSLTGQTVNHAVVLDFSRHMNGVLEVNREELWARVQPGLVQDELNHHVRPLGLLFGPDTSTSNRATIGGMLGNNSGGSHSIAYGLTVEHVIEIDHDPRRRQPRGVRRGDARAVRGQDARCPGSRAQIYREVARIRDAVRRRDPDAVPAALAPRVRLQPGRAGARTGRSTWRGSSSAPRARSSPWSRPRCASCSKPKATAVDVIHYHDMQEALESSQSILETGPYAVELTDKMILDLARNNIEQAARMGFVQGDPAAILIVEYAGDTEQEVKAKVEDARGAADARALRLRLPHRHRPGRAAVHLEAAQGRARPAPRHAGRGQAHRLHRGHRGGPEAPARVRAALHARSWPSTARTAPTTATARWAACTSAR